MNYLVNFPALLMVASIAGLLGYKSKKPGGAIIAYMLTIILINLLRKVEWPLPIHHSFVLQVMVGVMVGAAFKLEMLQIFKTLFIQIIISTLILVLSGLAISFVIRKFTLLDMRPACLSTIPGAMTVLIALAVDSGKNPAVITSFHFVRIVFFVLTMLVIYRYFFH